ncbi:hypothetical protein D3C72_2388890 [compost metagenome]
MVCATVFAIALARLFGPDGVVGVGGEQGVDDRRFGRVVDFGHEIVGLLGGDPDRLHVQRGAVDDGAGKASGLDGHVEHGVECGRHKL